MKWMIIIFIMMSLLGSIMWVMPTKRQKYQAALRMAAKKEGFQVQLERTTAPRAKGEMDAESKDMTAYRLLRQNLNRAEKNNFKSWQIFKVDAIANTGLPDGWSWAHGEKTLDENALQQLAELIEALPDGIFSIESSPIYLGVFWDENGGEQRLKELKQTMETFLPLQV